MQQAVEWFVAITSLVIGLSHMARPADWAAAFGRLHSLGNTGAIVNGGMSLATGAVIVAGHRSREFPGVVITVFGWLLVAKGAICLLAPAKPYDQWNTARNRHAVLCWREPCCWPWERGVATVCGAVCGRHRKMFETER